MPDVSDLLPQPIEVAPEENFYARALELGARFLADPVVAEDAVDETAPPPPRKEPDEDEAPGLCGVASGHRDGEADYPPKLHERLGAGEGWTPERVALYRSALEALVAEVRELYERYPLAQGDFEPDYTSPGPGPAGRELRSLGTHLRLAAWARYRAGEQVEAAEVAVLALEVGRRLRDSRGSLIDHLTGIAVMGMMQETIESWLRAEGTKPDALRALSAGFETLDEVSEQQLRESYAHSLRVEFGASHAILRDHVTRDKMVEGGTGMGAVVDVMARSRVFFPLVYKRHRSLALHADGVREEFAWAKMSVVEEKRLRKRPENCPHCDALLKSRWRPRNIYGEYLVTIIMPTVGRIRLTGARSESRISALRALTALRLYSLEHDGGLPGALDELVPAYLPAVPRDFADGGPIRYSREARALWSVGLNELRLTAADQEVRNEREELIVRLSFPASAP